MGGFDVTDHDNFDVGGHVFGELDSEGAPGYWSLQARFFDAGGVEVGVQEAISLTNPGHSWTRINGIVTKPISATTMRVELVSKETSGWVTFDDIFVLKAPSPLIPPPPTSVKYYYFGGQRVAMRRTNHDTDESTLHYLHADHLGSTRLVTDENGDAISNQGYFAFGSERSGGPIPTDHSFTGQKVDRSGLLYYNARYYDPELGVFVSPDTIVPDPTNVFAYNRYMYVFGNPLRFSDPSGHCSVEEDGSAEFNGSQITGTNNGCWSAANEWLATFGTVGIDNADDWFKHFASNPDMTEEVFRRGLHRYWAPLYRQWGVHHVRYNPAPVMNPMPEGVNEMYVPDPCNFWDCPAIAFDVASLGTSIAQTGAVGCAATGVGTPACASAAQYLTVLDVSISVSAASYDIQKYQSGDSTAFDVSLGASDVIWTTSRAVGAGASATPGVGVVVDSLQLVYDLTIDPFVRTPGNYRVAK